MRPYYEHGGITIYHGDCREILPSVTGEAVITDPPYGVGFKGKEWDATLVVGWLPLARAAAPVVAFTTSQTTLWDYPRPDWVLCWNRLAAQSRTVFGTFSHWTPVLVYGKGSWPTDTKTIHAPTVGAQNKGIDHPSPKPQELMRWLILGATEIGGMVLDPFMGSGTTLRAAKDLNRKAIGIEIEEKYCEIAAQRLSQEVLAL